ncbi:hypothetical protein [Pseudomonas aeruginosa]|uniref:hypothetical protein n=1 Tax=Pseudomonas aeruginosa TaxID=287 RepID=UPI0032AEBC2A
MSGRIRVEWVAGSPWNRWSDAHGMGGQMTVESADEQWDHAEKGFTTVNSQGVHEIVAEAMKVVPASLG